METVGEGGVPGWDGPPPGALGPRFRLPPSRWTPVGTKKLQKRQQVLLLPEWPPILIAPPGFMGLWEDHCF